MGGLAGVRRGRTAGDLTGGGGRSVEAVRRGGDPRRSGLSRVFGHGYYPPPPGGGYSGGVIPSFQGGGRTGYAPSSYTSPVDQYGRSWGFKRRHLGKSFDPRVQTKATQYALQNYWGQPPGGGYSGGVIPRFQSGRTMNPRAAGEEAMKRQRRMQWNARTTAGGPAGWGAYGSPFGPNARFPSPPGGWQAGGRTGTPRAALKAWGYNRPGNPNALTRSTTDEGRRRMYEAMRAGVAPGFGGRGWQAGGQFPEASFPVENQLADESPWYPDEEVGYEEAAPMQGGFDVFGRGGG